MKLKKWQAALIVIVATGAICAFMYWNASVTKTLDPAVQEQEYYGGLAVPEPPKDRAAGGL